MDWGGGEREREKHHCGEKERAWEKGSGFKGNEQSTEEKVELEWFHL